MIEQEPARGGMVDRMIGAARLDQHAYEDVERDEDATAQAAIIVVLAALAAGIGALDGGIDALIGLVIAGIFGWLVYAAVAYFVGTRFFAGTETASSVGELLRTLGFAQTPRLLLVLAFIPVLGILLSIAVFFWILLTTVVAIRQALDFSTGRAVATAIVSVLVLFVVQLIVVLIFGGF
ncbi:MAG TPA: YIP1 family protein [Dehalococcoidia bacterium]|nr:YIP1 family protein [Dehalococcoidia bacterium]